MEQKRIKVRFKKNSPYSNYGYYEKGDIGYIDGYVNDSAVIILENGKFAKADLRWIEVVNEEDENVNSELAETEDEKIRKELIENLRELSKMYDSLQTEKEYSKVQSWIAWLEKQGGQKPIKDICDTCDEKASCVNPCPVKLVEQKPAEWSNICEFSLKTWNDIVAYVLKEHNGIGNYLDDPEVRDTAKRLQEKYKFDCASEEWDRVYRKGLDAGVNYGKAEALRVQAPVEWSDEDENHVKSILSTIECCKAQFPYAQAVVEAYNADIKWLESLRPQNVWISVNEEVYVKEPVLAQKKDKSDPSLGFVVCYDHTLTPNVYERYMILGNIVSQNTWKPSEEQMKVLRYLDKGTPLNDFDKRVLHVLIDQLKKLREE